MTLRKIACLATVLSIAMIGCQKKFEAAGTGMEGEKVLVVVTGKPQAYTWDMEAIDTAVSPDHKFQENLSDYPLNRKLRDAIVDDLSRNYDYEVLPICMNGEEPATSGCVPGPEGLALLDKRSGQKVLAVSPCEYGVRNQKPYLALNVGLFDFNSGKTLSRYGLSLNDKEIEKHAADLTIADRDEVCDCIDYQIGEMAKKISASMENAGAVYEDPSLVYAGYKPITVSTGLGSMGKHRLGRLDDCEGAGSMTVLPSP